jgi:PAS domain S-box-containing protein
LPESVPPRPLRILIVEDSKNDAFLLERELHRGGFTVTSRRVDTAAEMRAALEQESWDIITSDHVMPTFSAPAALALAKELCPEIPFIIVSGEIDLKLATSLMKAGAHDYIQKRELPLVVPSIERELEEVEVRRQHQLAEEARRISEEKFFKAFHNSPDAINLSRLSDGVYLEVNEGFEQLTGLKASEVIGKSTFEINAWTYPEDRERLAAKLLKDGQIDNEYIMSSLSKDGIPKPALVSARLITVNGETCVLAFTRDISASVRAEEEIRRQNRELQKASRLIQQYTEELEARVDERTIQLSATNQELEAFIYTVAHDLRAPLRAIDGFSRIMQDEQKERLDADGQELLDHIIENTQRMQQMLDALLALSGLTQGSLNRETVDLSAMAQTIIEDLEQRNPTRHVTWQIEDRLTAWADRLLLFTVLENLLDNAWKFTAQTDKAMIELGSQSNNEQPQKTVYYVRDNGIGFDMQQAEQLFRVFYRLNPSEQFPGSGVGLASAKRILHRHGGHIWAESEPGEGSTFYFTLE